MRQTLKGKKKKEKKRKKNPRFRNSRTSVLVVLQSVTPLASRPVCLHLLGRFGAGIWWFWSPLVVGRGLADLWGGGLAGLWAGGLVAAWWACKWWPSGPVRWRPGRPVGRHAAAAWAGGSRRVLSVYCGTEKLSTG
jgi:hypothetical protein